jgi:hypothetical protein
MLRAPGAAAERALAAAKYLDERANRGGEFPRQAAHVVVARRARASAGDRVLAGGGRDRPWRAISAGSYAWDASFRRDSTAGSAAW